MMKLKYIVEGTGAIRDEKQLAALRLIKMAWPLISNQEDRYDFDDVRMYIDNDQKISNLAWELAKKFYPDSEEPWYEFQNDVQEVLYQLEIERLERKRKQNPSLKDPLYILKKLMVKTSWQQAKDAISQQLPGRGSHSDVTDEDAELIFNRLYKNAMGETVYNKEEIARWGYGRLDAARILPDKGNHRQYALNAFIRTYAGSVGKFDGKVRVWRGTNSPYANIRPGDFVTFDRGYAQGYFSGKWKTIVTDILDAKDFLIYKTDIGMSELVYWPEGHKIKVFTGHIPSLRDFWETYRFGL